MTQSLSRLLTVMPIFAQDKPAFLAQIEVLAKKEYKTFPMVFWDGEFVGGYTDTVKQIQKRVVSN
jgi:glutaredoxin